MNDIESIIDAILQGKNGDGMEALSKIEVFQRRSALLEVLIPAIGTLEEMKARCWDEGQEAHDTYLRDTFVATDEGPEKPKNPYRTGVL